MLRDREIQKKFKNLQRLPTIRDVGRILESFIFIDIENSPDVEREILFIISHDPSLTFNTLKVANSAYYALSRKIVSVKEAISIIGFSDLSEYVLKPAIREYLSPVSYYDWRSFWFHGIATAFTSEYIAKIIGFEEEQKVFTASLIHDIGKMAEFLSYPILFKNIIKRSTEEWRPFFEVEREMTGVDHAFLGSFFARMWRFPYEYIESIGLHHENDIPDEFHGEETRIISTIVMIANNIVKYYGITTPGASHYDLTNRELFDFLGFNEKFIDDFSFEIRKKTMITLERIGISFKI